MGEFIDRRPGAGLVVVSALRGIHRINKSGCDCTGSCRVVAELGDFTSDGNVYLLLIRRAQGRATSSGFSVVSNAGKLLNTTSNTFVLAGRGHADGVTALRISNESRRSRHLRLVGGRGALT